MPKILSDNGHSVATLDSLNVLSLQALRAFDHVELHGLALLQASEAARLNRREMHKYIFAGLTADKAVAFGVVKPLYCSLFCHGVRCSFSVSIYAGEIRKYYERLLAVEARTAHVRFELTYLNDTRRTEDWQVFCFGRFERVQFRSASQILGEPGCREVISQALPTVWAGPPALHK